MAKKMGRPCGYTEEIAIKICSRLAAGQVIADICSEPGMPSHDAVTEWQMKFPEFAVAYMRARAESADYFADRIIKTAMEMVKIADDAKEDWVFNEESGRYEPNHDIVQRSRLKVEARTKMIDHLKWTAAKLKPQSYGERLEAHLTGQIEQRNLNVNVDVSSLPPAAREALRLALQPKVTALSSGPGLAPSDDDGED